MKGERKNEKGKLTLFPFSSLLFRSLRVTLIKENIPRNTRNSRGKNRFFRVFSACLLQTGAFRG
jgi:hypothetical protein